MSDVAAKSTKGKSPELTLTFLDKLDRYAGDRAPRFPKLVEFIQKTFPTLKVFVDDWSYTPYQKTRRIRHVTGKTRHGKRLEVKADGGDGHYFGPVLFSYKTTDAYATNWDIIRWILVEARERKLLKN